MAAKAKKTALQPPRRPERKIGPFHNGLGVSIWLNQVETEQGTRYFRSISLAPRRYRDNRTGEWKDATSYRPIDLGVIQLAIAEALRFCANNPLPGQAIDGDEYEEMHPDEEADGIVTP